MKMTNAIKIRGYYLERRDAGRIPPRDFALLYSLPQLFNALQHAKSLLSVTHPKEYQELSAVIEQAMGGKETENYKAENIAHLKLFTIQTID